MQETTRQELGRARAKFMFVERRTMWPQLRIFDGILELGLMY